MLLWKKLIGCSLGAGVLGTLGYCVSAADICFWWLQVCDTCRMTESQEDRLPRTVLSGWHNDRNIYFESWINLVIDDVLSWHSFARNVEYCLLNERNVHVIGIFFSQFCRIICKLPIVSLCEVNPLKTKRRSLYFRPRSYRAVNTFHLGYKNQSVHNESGTSRCYFSDKYKTHNHSVSGA